MGAILTTFGIDWHLLMINIINFAVLMVGLWYFLYAPITKMLEERRLKIAHGVEAADQAEAQLKDIESTRTQKLAEAGKQADDLVAKARAAAAAKEKELRDAAERSAESILEDAEAQAGEIRAKAIAESKEEVAKLIVLGMEKAMTK